MSNLRKGLGLAAALKVKVSGNRAAAGFWWGDASEICRARLRRFFQTTMGTGSSAASMGRIAEFVVEKLLVTHLRTEFQKVEIMFRALAFGGKSPEP